MLRAGGQKPRCGDVGGESLAANIKTTQYVHLHTRQAAVLFTRPLVTPLFLQNVLSTSLIFRFHLHKTLSFLDFKVPTRTSRSP